MISLTLPYPPSTNAIWRQVDGRTLVSKKYRQWMATALSLVALAHAGQVSGGFKVTITAHRPDRRRRDLDNLLKPILDCLVKAQVVEDDSKAKAIAIEWADDEPSERAGVDVCVVSA